LKSSPPSTDFDILAVFSKSRYNEARKKEGFSMKLILKILAAPVIAILVVFIWLCALLLRLSAWVFGIVSTILGVLGLAVLILDNVTNGIIILVFAFLVSPMGLPMVAAWMIGQMQRFRYFVQDAIYG
jgi:hypothetical protein